MGFLHYSSGKIEQREGLEKATLVLECCGAEKAGTSLYSDGRRRSFRGVAVASASFAI
jgi:hypothetical protein